MSSPIHNPLKCIHIGIKLTLQRTDYKWRVEISALNDLKCAKVPKFKKIDTYVCASLRGSAVNIEKM